MKTKSHLPLSIYGRGRKVVRGDGLIKMKEIAILADPKTLREVAKFILEAAKAKEKIGANFGHRHLQDDWGGYNKKLPDIIVA